ncbi:DnaJ domain-containing protein [Glaciimonas soli]|uniref:DnaJ domain-containing protein n=1 Tax=Glaciimonas soli TaxID=2590999 RepID=A0A843Z016_9BURK|nr:DnaJ domain-containing protein [Glaciimonas soli]MQR02146.1 DnaJ domain-containing protein [Glaciimonas soli]
MNTLYDILGVSRQTTAAQIEQGYKFSMESLKSDGDNKSTEEILAHSRAIKEAYAILSSSSRRQAYDDKLKLKEQTNYEVVEKKDFPWGIAAIITVIALLLVAGLGYSKIQAHKEAEAQRMAFEIEKAKVDAEQAAKLADAEQARLEQQARLDQNRADAIRRSEAAQAHREGQQIDFQMQAAAAQAARDKAQADRQAKWDQQREEQAAQARTQNQNWALERAINTPIRRY